MPREVENMYVEHISHAGHYGFGFPAFSVIHRPLEVISLLLPAWSHAISFSFMHLMGPSSQ